MTNGTEDGKGLTKAKEKLTGFRLEVARLRHKYSAAFHELNSSLVQLSKSALSNQKSRLSGQISDHLIDQYGSFNPNKNLIHNSENEHEDDCVDGSENEIEFTEDNHLILDDSDGDEDASAYFPCPFCYIDIEVHLLCSHLQDEHCFDLKNAVCPLCASNLGKDVIGHFIVQHASSLKRRRRSMKSGFWTCNSAMIGRDLSSFLGSPSNGGANTNEAAPDPLLSPFLGGLSHSHPERCWQEEFFSNASSKGNPDSEE